MAWFVAVVKALPTEQECKSITRLSSSSSTAIGDDVVQSLTERLQQGHYDELETRRIIFDDTPPSILGILVSKEAVHPMQDLKELKGRLGHGRRVYSLFHPSLLPGQPLVFVHVALSRSDDIPSTMQDVLVKPSRIDEVNPKTATFYSISNAEPGFSGVRLGEYLLKQAMNQLREEFPSLETFVTLSPMPFFRAWLEEKIVQNQEGGHFLDESILSEEDWSVLRDGGLIPQESTRKNWSLLGALLERLDSALLNTDKAEGIAEDIQHLLTKLAARYIVVEKHRKKPYDGVARFHIGNGALLHQINFAADLSSNGLERSYGMMVNYLYDMEKLQENQKAYTDDYRVAVNPAIAWKWLSSSNDSTANPRSRL